ncbi:MAG: peptidase M13 [Actinomycetales bacterium]|nr:peptidase M13 [Actinomycetales bacterium]
MTAQFGIDASAQDKSVRPQDDFYRFINGGWLNSTEIPADKPLYGAFIELRDKSEREVHDIITEAASDANASGIAKKLGDLYASFMDEARADELGVAPIAAELKLIETIRGIDDVTKLLGEFERSGVSGLFGTYIENDMKNPERYIPMLFQGGLGLPDEAYYREPQHAETLAAYQPHIAQMLHLAGWSNEDADAAAARVVAFETELAKHHMDVVESRNWDTNYQLYSYAQLQELTPTFDWSLYLAGAGIEASALDEVVVFMPEFHKSWNELYTNDNLEALKSWLAWQVVSSMAPYLSSDIVAQNFEFFGRRLSGTQENRPRWKRAVSLIEGSLGEALGEVYVQRHFPESSKRDMEHLVENLLKAYEISIKDLDWMSEATRAKALEKLSKFTPKIGYPSKFKDYTSLHISADDLVGNVRHVSAWVLEDTMSKLGKPIDRDEWHMTPQTVNAYYNPTMNEIVFPAAILQWPFYSPDSDKATNYGGIGAVIGHEIGHGFDDKGSTFNGDGALEQWWTEEDLAKFKERTKALIDQYDVLVPKQLGDSTEHHVNGAFTIGENIGDLGGAGIAYKAYKIALNGAEDEIIDGLTGDQRFFASYAQIWRSKGRDEIVIQRLATDPHSPGEFRANQILKNIDAFYEAFEVKPGDGMWLDPADRVKIW